MSGRTGSRMVRLFCSAHGGGRRKHVPTVGELFEETIGTVKGLSFWEKRGAGSSDC